MKRLLAVALFVAGAAAFADQTQQPQQQKSSTSQNWEQMKSDFGLQKNTPSQQQSAVLHNGHQYQISGTVADSANGNVHVRRPGLPDAKLKINKETIVALDGARVEGKKLPKGAAVSAQFQLKGDSPIATRIDASLKPLQGTGGSGQKQMEQKPTGYEQRQEQIQQGPRQLQGHSGSSPGKDSEDIPTKGKTEQMNQQQHQKK